MNFHATQLDRARKPGQLAREPESPAIQIGNYRALVPLGEWFDEGSARLSPALSGTSSEPLGEKKHPK